jgi:hypothetical protein
LICLNAKTASIKVAVIVGINVLLIFGKKTDLVEVVWRGCISFYYVLLGAGGLLCTDLLMLDEPSKGF